MLCVGVSCRLLGLVVGLDWLSSAGYALIWFYCGFALVLNWCVFSEFCLLLGLIELVSFLYGGFGVCCRVLVVVGLYNIGLTGFGCLG